MLVLSVKYTRAREILVIEEVTAYLLVLSVKYSSAREIVVIEEATADLLVPSDKYSSAWGKVWRADSPMASAFCQIWHCGRKVEEMKSFIVEATA